MNGLDQIAVFVAVVDAKGFTAAARELGMPKSSVSRKVAELEERLGIQLLQRTTRTVRPTDVGERFYAEAQVGIEALRRAEVAAERAQDQPRGTLRVTSVANLTTLGFGRLINRYLSAYPDVSLELRADPRTIDLVREGYDVAIRAGRQPDSSLVSRTLTAMESVLCAAPAYLAERGRPARPADLADHLCVLMGTDRLERGDNWTLTHGKNSASVPVRGRVRVNDPRCAYDVCLGGQGIASLPAVFAAADLESGRLERVLTPWTAGEMQLQLVFPGNRLLDPKTRAFIEMAKEHFDALEFA